MHFFRFDMTDNGYARYSIYLAIFFAGVYFVNLAYVKLLAEQIVQPIRGFDGLINTDQVIIIFLMSIFFVVHVIHRSRREKAMDGS